MLKSFLGKDTIKTNAYSVIGKTGIVTKEINPNLSIGQVKISGEVWSAKADELIPVGSEIEVLEIDGVKAVVKAIVKAKLEVSC